MGGCTRETPDPSLKHGAPLIIRLFFITLRTAGEDVAALVAKFDKLAEDR